MQEKLPIQVVARRTGLTPEALRAWERRYGAVTPERTPGSRRLYSAADVERLILLRRLTAAGRSIGQIARQPTEDLRRLLMEDEQAARKVLAFPAAGLPLEPHSRGRAPAGSGEAPEHLERCMEAVSGLDVAVLEAALDRAYVALGQIAVLDQVLLPLLREIGERWRHGTLRVVHEHFASAVIRTVLTNMARAYSAAPEAPALIVATPSGQPHEFGALVAAATAASEGWRAVYLGAGLPAEEIACAALQKKAAAVALSLVHPGDDPSLGGELLRLRRLLPPAIAIMVGGAAAGSYAPVLQSIGAAQIDDMPGLRRALEGLRAGEAR